MSRVNSNVPTRRARSLDRRTSAKRNETSTSAPLTSCLSRYRTQNVQRLRFFSQGFHPNGPRIILPTPAKGTEHILQRGLDGMRRNVRFPSLIVGCVPVRYAAHSSSGDEYRFISDRFQPK